ncbi:MAG: Nif3-like dinuclear metal center hexameric protein, partial [Chitinophagaceae bacterium]
MKIFDLTSYLESVAPLTLQEDYDNAGLLTGDPNRECTGVLCTLDVTEDVIAEAVKKKCNCIVAHHPLIFKGLKKLSGNSAVERTVIAAIKNDIAVYASHTNLDNIINGVNGKIAAKIGLKNLSVLQQKAATLQKLSTFVPKAHIDNVRDALFAAGAGKINNYSECSFSHPGTGTFRAEEGAKPFTGKVGERTYEDEVKIEVILPGYLKAAVLAALFTAHPYEEVAYDVMDLDNGHPGTGAGIVGEVEAISETDFLALLHSVFNGKVIRHTPLTGKTIRRVAVCGGAGSFLIAKALNAGADVFVTGDVKYHEFFGAEGRILLCDIGHYESEQFTTDLFI